MTLAAEKLLDEFRTLPGRVERPRTFMEIAGYPHYENVSSNILAFFMDPEESHGFGTLILDALASAGDIAAGDEGVGGNVSVEREVVTDNGNRIDILITSDNHAILIENKIYAGVSNPFDDYAAYLDHTADGRAKHKFLLTLYPTNEGNEWGFTNLTHEEFVGQIRLLLGRYVSSADTRYLTIFLDFLNTLENLQKGSRMNQEFLDLLSERKEDVEDFLTEIKGFEDELREKVRELGALIELEERQNVRQWFWRQKTKLLDVLVHDIHVSDDLPVFIDTVISPHEWDIRISVHRGGNHSKLKDLLQSLEIPEKGWGIHTFAYDESLDRISPVLQDIIDKLSTYRGA
ncbi:MAG: PD-(D/E)XK nuclease family protein [Rubrobacteraceae bacterium]